MIVLIVPARMFFCGNRRNLSDFRHNLFYAQESRDKRVKKYAGISLPDKKYVLYTCIILPQRAPKKEYCKPPFVIFALLFVRVSLRFVLFSFIIQSFRGAAASMPI